MFKTQANKRAGMVLAVITALAAWIIMVSGAAAQDATAAAPQGEGVHTVEIGDTLDTIAQRYNVSIISLFEVNGFDYGTVLFPGDSVVIPTDGTPYGYFPALSLGNRSAIAIYIIQPLDVLDLVAAFFDVDLQCLAEFNGMELMDTNRIYPGTAIGIPTDCPEYRGMSSYPLLPLRGVALALTGASVRLTEGEQSTVATPSPTPTAAVNVVVPTATVAVVIPPTATPSDSGVIVQTPVPSGGVIRGATVTPTPQG